MAPPRKRRRLAWPIIAALAFIAVFAARRSAPQQRPTFPALPADSPVGSGIVAPCTTAAPGSSRCGVFRVAEVREGSNARSGRTIDIAFVILDALDSTQRTRDALMLLPGGPGEPLTPIAAGAAVRLRDVRRTRDILLVDVRGVGRSSPLSCNVPFPGGLRSRLGTLFPLDHAAACRDTLARRARLDAYTTASAVDDLEDLRRWLGYDALNLMGGSYGTRVAQVFMRRHPRAVRTVVLNGVGPVAEPIYVQHAFLLQRALDRLLAECRADTVCHAAYPDLQQQLAQLFERFRQGPVEVEVEGTRVPFGAGDLAYALRGLLYGRGAELPRIIHAAAGGAITPLATYYLQRTDWVGSATEYAGYHFSVLCAEDIAPLTDADVARHTRGTFMGAHLINGYRAVCRQWPHARLPASHWTPVASDVPTLLLSGGRDPVTPPEGADSVAAHLTRKLHVVVPNGGHGVWNTCISRMVTHLITTASLDGVDTSCVAAAPPTRFVTR